jgi:hypothetical protein
MAQTPRYFLNSAFSLKKIRYGVSLVGVGPLPTDGPYVLLSLFGKLERQNNQGAPISPWYQDTTPGFTRAHRVVSGRNRRALNVAANSTCVPIYLTDA